MTVIPASSLSVSEMQMLGNNVAPRFYKDRRNRLMRGRRPVHDQVLRKPKPCAEEGT
jgi:hypothetical protein